MLNHVVIDPIQEAPQYVHSWLTLQTSLSDRLKLIKGNSQVNRIKQDWSTVNWWEKYHLHLQGKVLRREVIITANDQPYWYARTIIPEEAWNAAPQLFQRLEKESLGDILYYSQQEITRFIHPYKITPAFLEWYWVPNDIRGKGPMWGRLSTFILNGKQSFFLIELFLPALENVQK